MHWLDLEEPDIERPRRFARFRDAVAARKKALVGAACAAPVAVALVVALAPRQYRAEVQIFIAGAVGHSAPQAVADFSSLAGQASLIASPELGLRAIEALGAHAKSELDPAAEGANPLARVLILLRLKRDPVAVSTDQRILDSFEDRISVSTSHEERRVKIAFCARDGAFAARAANLIAGFYLDMRASAGAIGSGSGDALAASASIVSPAVAPHRPEFPSNGLLCAIGGSAALAAASALGAFRRAPRPASGEEPMPPPRAVGEPPFFIRLKEVPKPFAPACRSAASRRAEAENAQALEGIAMRIISARRTSGGLRIIGAKLSLGHAAPDIILALARLLSGEGRAILIGLDADASGADAIAARGKRNLSDLISGRASFAEVIRRDPGSRLHFVAAAESGPIDNSELAGVIDALARTYDFIFLTAPALDANAMARVLATNADVVVLTAPPEPHDAAIVKAEADLRACGAREILVVGARAPLRQSIGMDAA